MTIDPLREQPISLKEAAKLFPKNARGKHPHLSAIYRYTTRGCRGVVLESIQAGSRRCTSREAVARFFHRLTEQADTPPKEPPDPNPDRATEAGRLLDATVFKSRRNSSEGGEIS